MLTKVMKFACIAALLAALVLWTYASSYQVVLCFVICLGAVVVAVQAVRAKRRVWATGFFIMAAAFNPVLIVVTFSGMLSLILVLAGMAAFGASLSALKTQPLLSIPSITGRTPNSESL